MKVRPIATKLKTTDYTARAAVHTGEINNAKQIVITISSEDAFGIPSVLCHLKLSPSEASRLTADLIKATSEDTQAARDLRTVILRAELERLKRQPRTPRSAGDVTAEPIDHVIDYLTEVTFVEAACAAVNEEPES